MGPTGRLRVLRALPREQDRALDAAKRLGPAGLQGCAERGQACVAEVRSLVAYGRLTEYDHRTWPTVTAGAGCRDSG
ncbi:MAG: hypothetical protein U5R48_18360 [Gammaproteobacteria bacterium]|nr:hypothetical protein [Gammaproteobacteria bacterium]